MKTIEQVVPTGTKFSIGFIGDVQYGNPGFSDGAWSRAERAFRTIKEQTDGAPLYIVGVGDYIDFMSPSNRAAYKASGIYSSSTRSIAERTARPLVDEFLAMAKRLDGTWIAVLQGHHWADVVLDADEDFDGDDGPPIGHSDKFIAEQLGAKFATSSALINFRIDSKTFRLLAHHGGGGGAIRRDGHHHRRNERRDRRHPAGTYVRQNVEHLRLFVDGRGRHRGAVQSILQHQCRVDRHG